MKRIAQPDCRKIEKEKESETKGKANRKAERNIKIRKSISGRYITSLYFCEPCNFFSFILLAKSGDGLRKKPQSLT